MYPITYGKSSICYTYVNACTTTRLTYIWKLAFNVILKSLYDLHKIHMCCTFVWFAIGETYTHFAVKCTFIKK